MENNWINTKERLPEQSGMILGCTDFNYISQFYYSAKYKLFMFGIKGELATLDSAQNYSVDVAYWQPLPELPERLNEVSDVKPIITNCQYFKEKFKTPDDISDTDIAQYLFDIYWNFFAGVDSNFEIYDVFKWLSSPKNGEL